MDQRPTSPGPYFFLSYAHTPTHVPHRRANKWVAKLFSDLCEHILQLTNLTDPAQAGFMDIGLRSGHLWQERLAEALATCRVFVPLYSPRYFESLNCGREWTAFARRLSNHVGPDGQAPEAIIPALWTPMAPESLPLAAKEIQFSYEQLGARYREEGFYGLAKLAARRTQYQIATWELANRIVFAAQNTWIRPSDRLDFESLPSAFLDHQAERLLRLTIVAPDLARLPPERTAYYYGRACEEWNPYRSEDNARSLCSYAVDIAAAHGFRARIGSLADHLPDLRESEKADHPSVMIIDPWAVTHAGFLTALSDFDKLRRGWVSVLVPWNLDDEQTREREPELRQALEKVLGERLTDPHTETVTSFAAFRRALPDALGRATNQFLVIPPIGADVPVEPMTQRPRLMDPGGG
ncbi:hypothetical protein GCM10009555_072150 [Acrocarpospora macrocephala]|uniref:TIR domain-containing protein n=1 Tax=Acrocarpospora macrocephala TaxID=150177 RepID=A0A5M3WKF0_9ACTN|nr:hypothetical protein Amac_022350 [Acrocarpospora macrocephala]